MAATSLDSITTIDGHYMYEGRAAAYLVVDGEEAAFVDTCTRFSVPHLLQALETKGVSPEQVRYILVTHVHLDHCGGTAELVKHCPNATVIAHPRAARHIVDPTKLVAGATAIYGEEAFAKLYGEIGPVDEARVQIVEDGDTLPFGSRTFTLYHTPGHAPHHYVVHDSACNAMICGDAYGLSYKQLQEGSKPYLSYVCAPPSFNPQQAKESMQRIFDTGVDRVFVTHFGEFEDLEEGLEQVLKGMDIYDALATELAATDLEGEALAGLSRERTLQVIKDELTYCGLDPGNEDHLFWATSELNISSQGVAVLAERRRKEAAE